MTINFNDIAKFNGVVDSNADFGYKVIGGMLVSNLFMERLTRHLDSIRLEYGVVFDPGKVCGENFLKSLTEEEREVLGPCILVLIDEGAITMNFSRQPE